MTTTAIERTTRRPERAGHGEVLISARDVTVGFGDKLVLENLSLDVYRGEILGFVGAWAPANRFCCGQCSVW